MKRKLPKFRSGDMVKVLTGPDRGKQGKITQVLSREQRAVVEGVNIRKKNVRARRERQKGEIVDFNAPVHLSNLLLVCPHCHATTRMKALLTTDGKKARQCRKCSTTISP